MSSSNDLLKEVLRIEKASKRTIPFTTIGLVGILAAILISANALTAMRADIAQLDGELSSKKEAISNAEKKLNEVEKQLQEIQAKLESLQVSVASIPARTPSEGKDAVEKVLLEAAAIDAAAAVASADIKSKSGESSSVYGSTNIDFFFCSDSNGANKESASAALRFIGTSAAGRWRLRALSPEVNAGTGYRISSNVVRYNPDERDIAIQLKNDIKVTVGTEPNLQEISYPTPRYVSAFFCAAK